MREESQLGAAGYKQRRHLKEGTGASIASLLAYKRWAARQASPHTQAACRHTQRIAGYSIPCEIPSPEHRRGSQEHGNSEGMAPVLAAVSLGPPRSFQPSPPALHGNTNP